MSMNTIEQVFIYVLKHPETTDIRYVGKAKNIKKRLRWHIDYAKYNRKRRKVSDWILSILRMGRKPIIEIIEIVNEHNWQEREIYWIKHYRSTGIDLCNLTNGGETTNGYIYSDELKNIRKKARTGWVAPDSVKQAIAETLSKPVICIETGTIYKSLKEATIDSGVPKSTFHRKLHKKEKINNKTYDWYTNKS